jgi:tRNA(fMet)-specific endonuclease VapC
MVIIDTSIIIDHLRQKNTNVETKLIKLSEKFSTSSLSISVLTIQELYEGKSTSQPEKESQLLLTLAPLKVHSYSYQVAKLAGEIARDSKTPMQFVDAAIAATAVYNNSTLATLNQKDFLHISNLDLYNF